MEGSIAYIALITLGVMVMCTHIPLAMITVAFWMKSQLSRSDLERFDILNKIAGDLNIDNCTFPPQKKLNYFSWLVYNKRVEDHYIPYKNLLRSMSGSKELKIKPDSMMRYFYGCLFNGNHPRIQDIIATDENAEPYIMVSRERVKVGKNNYEDYRVLYYRSNDLDMPKCNVKESSEFIDNIAPDPADINFVSDETFSKKFDLIGDDEQKIRALINDEVRGILVDNQKWTWQFDGNRILIRYLIEYNKNSRMSDIKSSLGELAKIHKAIRKIDMKNLPSSEQIDADTPKEIIDKKLYNKRMAIFGSTIGCGTIAMIFGIGIFGEALIRMQFGIFLTAIFFTVPGILAFRFGYTEWKRNKKLKSEGKVRSNSND